MAELARQTSHDERASVGGACCAAPRDSEGRSRPTSTLHHRREAFRPAQLSRFLKFVSSWRWHEELHIPCQPEAFRNKSTGRISGTVLPKLDRQM